MKDGTPAYTYNWLGIEQFDVVAKQKVPAGQGGMFGVDETADVGVDQNTPVNPAYKGKTKFTGKINKVTVETFADKKP